MLNIVYIYSYLRLLELLRIMVRTKELEPLTIRAGEVRRKLEMRKGDVRDFILYLQKWKGGNKYRKNFLVYICKKLLSY